jgi:hypothetical protein
MQAKKLTLKQDAWINFLHSVDSEPAQGRIIHISAVADGASDTLRVRVEVPNSYRRPAGERVTVKFSQTDFGG